MKNLWIVLALVFSFNLASAQSTSSSVEKDVILEKLDKNTQMAFVYQDGVLIEKGLLVNGKREGVWQSFTENGTLATEASFSKGMKNGVWNIYEGASLKYVLHYQNDSRVQANNLAIVQ